MCFELKWGLKSNKRLVRDLYFMQRHWKDMAHSLRRLLHSAGLLAIYRPSAGYTYNHFKLALGGYLENS